MDLQHSSGGEQQKKNKAFCSIECTKICDVQVLAANAAIAPDPKIVRRTLFSKSGAKIRCECICDSWTCIWQ